MITATATAAPTSNTSSNRREEMLDRLLKPGHAMSNGEFDLLIRAIVDTTAANPGHRGGTVRAMHLGRLPA